jgi:hypothetical protein
MSTALATFKMKQTRTGQHPAGVGATLAYNEIVKDVLPPIVQELEERITKLNNTVEELRKLLLETKH